MSFSSCRDCRSNAWTCSRSSIACCVNRPCLRAFWFCFGAPEPGAPRCIRQRFLPDTTGDRQEPPKRVLADCRDCQQSATHTCQYRPPIKPILREQSAILDEFTDPLRPENGKAKSEGGIGSDASPI